MILKINGFSNTIKFNDEYVNVINISNSKMFTNFLDCLNNKINGLESDEIFLLDEDNNILDISKKMYLLFDLFNIDFNSKKILNSLYDIIEENIKKNQDYELENMFTKIRNYLITELNELPIEVSMKQELGITEILKLYGVKIDNLSYTSILDRLEMVIDIITTLNIAEILIIPNLKQFLNEDEIVELYKYSLYNNVKLLIVERKSDKKLKYEINYTIDEEFDDFVE